MLPYKRAKFVGCQLTSIFGANNRTFAVLDAVGFYGRCWRIISIIVVVAIAASKLEHVMEFIDVTAI